MKASLLLLAAIFAGLAGARAGDAGTPLDAAATGFELRQGELQVHLYPDAVVWRNGVRWPTHDDDAALLMKPGDVFAMASPIKWHDVGKPTSLPPGVLYQFRLDQLTDRAASFTLCTFSLKVTELTAQTRQYTLGSRETESRFEVDVTQPHFLFGLDFGLNHVELTDGKIQRSK